MTQTQPAGLVSLNIRGVVVNDMRLIDSTYDGYDMLRQQRFKAGRKIAFKLESRLTSEERAGLFGTGRAYNVSIGWPAPPEAAVRTAEERSAPTGFQANEYQQKIIDALLKEGDPRNGDHMIIRALAGCGKTSTLVWLVKELRRMGHATKAIYLAFNKEIQEELYEKLKGTGVIAQTTHSFGFAALKRQFKALARPDFKLSGKERNRELFLQVLGRQMDYDVTTDGGRKSIRMRGEYKIAGIVCEMIGYIKSWAVFPEVVKGKWKFDADQEAFIDSLWDEFDIEIPDFSNVKEDNLPRLFDHKDPESVRLATVNYAIATMLAGLPKPGEEVTEIDFDDMIYLSLHLGVPLPKYDLVMVDESQDMSPLQVNLLERLSV